MSMRAVCNSGWTKMDGIGMGEVKDGAAFQYHLFAAI